MSERSEERELTALESALRELRPKRDEMDRSVLMYRAGRASARNWIWPTTTLFSTTMALVLVLALWMRPEPPVVYVAVPHTGNNTASTSLPPSPGEDYLEPGAWSRYVHLQEQVLLHGLDGLPASPAAAEDPPLDAESLLKSL